VGGHGVNIAPGTQVPNFRRVIGTGRRHFVPIGRKPGTQQGLLVALEQINYDTFNKEYDDFIILIKIIFLGY